MATIPFQPSLFDAPAETAAVSFDPAFVALERVWLDQDSWVDCVPGWVRHSDVLFEQILNSRKWDQRSRWLYEKKVVEPRLTASWSLKSGNPLEPAILDDLRRALSEKYGVVFNSIGFNLYRDGQDSVAWHGDRITKEIERPIVALVSVGEPRKFLMRPRGGGKSVGWMLGRGDLLVTGGLAQRAWDHSVPKVKQAGPRISLAFRYGLNGNLYSEESGPLPMAAENPPALEADASED